MDAYSYRRTSYSDLDWFPVSRSNIIAFFTLLSSINNIQHLEIGEMWVVVLLERASMRLTDNSFSSRARFRQNEFEILGGIQISLPNLHTLAISG
jgi:hypothetical protein